MARSSSPNFTPLNNITINGQPPPEVKCGRSKRICGVKAKIFVAAVLLLLLLIILTAAIVMIAVAAADKDEKKPSPVTDSTEDPDSTIIIPVSERVPCPLKLPASCTKAGCLYSEVDLSGNAVASSVPKCFYPKASYKLSSTSNIGDTSTYVVDDNVTDNEVSASLEQSDSDSALLTINGSSQKRRRRRRQSPTETTETNYDIKYHTDFGFTITRENKTILSLTDPSHLNVMDSFISLCLTVPKKSKAYGLGNFKQLEKSFDGSVYTMWTRQDEEGSHPFIMLLSEEGTASGIYIDSSYPMDITLLKNSQVNVVILQTELKIRIFTGPTMSDVIRQYWKCIGTPGRHPYWGLGHFYGSQEMATQSDLESLLTNATKLGDLPAEGILLSTKLNQDSLPFSLTTETQTYLKEVFKDSGTKFILTVAPSITSSTGEKEYYMDTAGVSQKVFITQNSETTDPIQGYYGKKMSKYPDFTASNSESWWIKNITDYNAGYGFHFHGNTPFNGLNGTVGVCSDLNSEINLATDILALRSLEENTLCLSAQSKKGLQLELHNKYALQQASVTQSALKPWSVSKQPLIVSDASSPGLGQHAGHFHDSNVNGIDGMKSALNEMVTYNFLGINMVGSNLCTKEMSSKDDCIKWYYLSVVSPLAWSFSSNLPPVFLEDPDFINTISTILQFRQTILPYHYDLQYKAHMNTEVPLKFMKFDYPTDKVAGLYQDQVLLGDAILYTPILRTGDEFRVSYLPEGVWCNWVDGSCYQGPTEVKVVSQNSPASFTFLKGGSAIVTQNSANTTDLSRKEKVHLIVVLDENGQANSTRYFDDGETANNLATEYYSLVNYSATNETLTVTSPHKGYRGGVMQVQYERILVYGLRNKVLSLKRTDNEQTVRISSIISGDTSFYKLIISDINIELELNEEFSLQWELKES